MKIYILMRIHIICAVTQTLAWKASAEKKSVDADFVLPIEGPRFTDARAFAISVNSYSEIRSASEGLVEGIHNRTSLKLHACR